MQVMWEFREEINAGHVYAHQKGHFQDLKGLVTSKWICLCLSPVTIWVPKCTGAAVMQRRDNCGHRIFVPSEAQNAKGYSIYQQERQRLQMVMGEIS